MKIGKIFKKITASFLLTVLIFGQFEGLKFRTEATTINTETGDKLYLGLSAVGNGIGYAMPNTSGDANEDTIKNIWSIKSYETADSSSNSVAVSNLYCIKAGYGYTWESVNREAVLTYTSSEFNKNSVDGYYNEILWLIDHMYVPGEDNKEVFLNSIGLVSYVNEEIGKEVYYYDPTGTGYDYSDFAYGEYLYTLTEEDIVAVQQAAIWYYTNYKIDPTNDAEYNQLGNNASWLKYTTDGTNYSELSQYNRVNSEGTARNEFAIVLYNYLIDVSASEISKLGTGETYNLSNKTVKLWTSTTSNNEEQPIIEIHQKVKTGNYNVILVKEDASGTQLNSTATFIVNEVEKTVTGQLTIASGVEITSDNLNTTDTYVIKEKTPPDQYCSFDGIITVSVTKKETTDGYEVNEVEYVVKDSAGNDITNQTGEDVNVYLHTDGNIYVKVKNYPEEKTFDLALRKEITSVTDSEGNSKAIINEDEEDATRNITVDKSTLNNEDENTSTDTATYKHRKDPVLVEKGDIVKYTITIFNEGEQAGYATKIVDQLPGTVSTGLRLISTNDVTSSTGNIYSVEYSTTTNKVEFTLKSSTPQTLAAYDGTTLSQEKITLECEVMTTPSTTQTMTLTNIAYIAEEYNSQTGETITTTGDRDSQPATYPSYSGENDAMQDGITYGEDVGYTGKEDNASDLTQNSTYYKGQQDDDDFEKLVILPESFDLSLRKVITEVDGTSTGTNRVINITGLTEVSNGTTTTAKYNHIKTPVEVKNGSKVTYNINIYNEGTTDGIATIIRDQLPTGLKLDLTTLLSEEVSGNTQYYVTTPKGNKYIIEYYEASNIIEFVLDTTTTVTNLKAFEDRVELDSDTIEIKCIVNCIADNEENIYLTNIAYIYEEKTLEGTVITDQVGIDRDSEPYTKPTKTADQLNTVGDIGYIGNTSNPTDLSQVDTHYKGEQDDDDFEKLVILPEAFDLSLRKVITKVNGTSTGVNREIKITALEELANGTKTTAEYNHIKAPVTVENGATVTYNINIYNEAAIDGIATIVKDQLPKGLKLDLTTLSSEEVSGNTQYYINTVKNNKYIVEYDETTNMVTFALDKTSTVTNLNAFKNRTELDSDTIEINCIVDCKADNEENIYLTNIAYIYEAEEVDGTVITNQIKADRDSEPYTKPSKTADELNTVGTVGYTGNENNPTDLNKADTHYKGEQDDDDFEKLVILPEAFDLSLRKVITKVNGTSTGVNREIKITELEELSNGTRTTAEYNHIKAPVTVENGATVTYNINIYNEAAIDGIATIVKDQLPKGLKLDLTTLSSEEVSGSTQYYINTVKNNKYIVEYDETTNMVTFTLDKTSTVTNLKAFKNRTELDSDTIEINCIVNCKADNEENIYLTNIAYIYEAEEVDGTVITNQVKADRDSEPYTKPSKTADELNTVGTVGYTGNENNPTDLNKADTYYKGEQDDDDFEKLVILPQAFDLSLRKVITKVNGTSTGVNREIKITALEELTNGTKTTAEYNHIKKPVEVKDGSKVTYNINIYNEAAIDGIATIIKDQLPKGLELDLNSLESQLVEGKTQYYVRTAKNNKYIVNYDTTTNIITFTLDKTSTVTNLKAFKNRTELDSDTLAFECIVDWVADEEQNTYLTNIAYIYEAEEVDGTVITNQVKADRDSEPHTKPDEDKDELNTVGNIGYIGDASNPTDLNKVDTHYKGEQDDDDFEKLVILPQTFDLKLIKYIEQLNGKDVGNRILNVDTSKLNTKGTDGRIITTAEYEMDKKPVSVKAGDIIKYTFRIYNEGDYDGYATEISEDIPKGLEMFIIRKDSSGNIAIDTWDGENLKEVTEQIKATNMYEQIVSTNSVWGYKEGTKVITTNALQDELIKAYGIEGYTNYADKENEIDYKEISVILRVKEDIVKENEKPIRNEAAITEDKAVDENDEEIINSSGNKIEDRDSNTEEWKKEDSGKDYNDDGWEIYKEDDEDYDNIMLKEFDLSLRKQIVTIRRNGKDVLYTGRYAKLDTDNSEANTIYNYYNVYNNQPLVRPGDIITYSIRVYNEGEVNGYAKLIADALPSGLEFVPYVDGDGSINDEYNWKLVEGTTNVYETDYLSYENDINKGKEESTIIKAYTGTGEADFEEVLIQCKVKEDVTKEDSLLNVAQIADDSDEDGKPIRDKDSEPGKTDGEDKWKNEDDLDIEIVRLEEFDLALRKFITEIEETGSETMGEDGEPNITEVTDRIPEVSYDKETNQITYTHTKEPLVVHVGDTVIYTIRVYNEGEIDGYVQEITDDIPEFLEYLPDHKTNQEFEWKMYDENGDETEDVSKAVKIKTIYLAKGEGKEKDSTENDENFDANLIKAFNQDAEISEANPDYRDVKVAFKVNDPDSSEQIIINFAQISEDGDENGEPVKDKDSEPDNGEGAPEEDDEDIEKVKVQYFDLSLLKYVTKVIVTEDGQQTITQTGNVGDENDIVPKVEINKKKINSTVVKFAYTIKITNEGEIAGYAKEITDYIPEGLKFNTEDNPNWTDEGNNIISTRQLEDVLLQPGESSEVEVILTWINGEDNLGAKINTAEISEDDNDEGVPDKDSIPDNKKDGEDDIDDAEVILSIKTGGGLSDIYTKITLGLCLIILMGIVLIKKYVL